MQSYSVYLSRKLNCKLILVIKNAPPVPGNCMCQMWRLLNNSWGFNECDPFAEVNARDITTGRELPKDIIENVLNADSIGNEKYLNFVTKRLVKGIKGFLNQLQNCKLLFAIKVKKTSNISHISNKGRHAAIWCHSWWRDWFKWSIRIPNNFYTFEYGKSWWYTSAKCQEHLSEFSDLPNQCNGNSIGFSSTLDNWHNGHHDKC